MPTFSLFRSLFTIMFNTHAHTKHKHQTTTIHKHNTHRLLDPQNRQVGQKLAVATACMFTLPIVVFYLTRHYFFAHKAQPDSWAGGAAILITNAIVAGYCIAAFSEADDDETKNSDHDRNENDVDGPRVGVFKKRTD